MGLRKSREARARAAKSWEVGRGAVGERRLLEEVEVVVGFWGRGGVVLLLLLLEQVVYLRKGDVGDDLRLTLLLFNGEQDEMDLDGDFEGEVILLVLAAGLAFSSSRRSSWWLEALNLARVRARVEGESFETRGESQSDEIFK